MRGVGVDWGTGEAAPLGTDVDEEAEWRGWAGACGIVDMVLLRMMDMEEEDKVLVCESFGCKGVVLAFTTHSTRKLLLAAPTSQNLG